MRETVQRVRETVQRVRARGPAPADCPDEPEVWVGRKAVWTLVTRAKRVRVLVDVVDAEAEKFGRVKVWVKVPSTGDVVDVSHLSLRLVPEKIAVIPKKRR